MARRTTPAQVLIVRRELNKLEPKIRRAFTEAMGQAGENVDFQALVSALQAGDVEGALDIVRVSRATLFPLTEAVRGGYVSGGALAATALPVGLQGRFGFDGRHPRAEAWVQEYVGDLIQGITDETVASTRAVILEGIQEGRSHREVARSITGRKVGRTRVGGYLGLTSEQTDYVINARRMLSDPDRIRNYFIKDKKTGKLKPRYKLSDRRFDKIIKKAIESGTSIKGRQLDQIIEAHKMKSLGYRGRVIARNEAHTALAAGREEGFLQLQEDSEVETVTVRWQHNLSQEPRKDHQAMDGTVIKLGEFFQFDDALMKHPHDPAGGARHSVGCRCIAVYRTKLRRD